MLGVVTHFRFVEDDMGNRLGVQRNMIKKIKQEEKSKKEQRQKNKEQRKRKERKTWLRKLISHCNFGPDVDFPYAHLTCYNCRRALPCVPLQCNMLCFVALGA